MLMIYELYNIPLFWRWRKYGVRENFTHFSSFKPSLPNFCTLHSHWFINICQNWRFELDSVSFFLQPEIWWYDGLVAMNVFSLNELGLSPSSRFLSMHRFWVKDQLSPNQLTPSTTVSFGTHNWWSIHEILGWNVYNFFWRKWPNERWIHSYITNRHPPSFGECSPERRKEQSENIAG